MYALWKQSSITSQDRIKRLLPDIILVVLNQNSSHAVSALNP